MLILVGASDNMIGKRDVIEALTEVIPVMSKKTLAQAVRELSIQELGLKTAKVAALGPRAEEFDKIKACLRARALALRTVDQGGRARQRV